MPLLSTGFDAGVDFGHFLIRRIARRRSLDGLFQKGHIRRNLLLAAAADQIAHVFAHGIKRPRLRVRPREFGDLGFNEMLMVTAFMPPS